MESNGMQSKEKTTFRSLPLEIQQQICSSAIRLSQAHLEDTFIEDKITWFNPVRIYNRLETCIKPNRLISASRFMNIWKACPGTEPVRRGSFAFRHILYIRITDPDIDGIFWLMNKLGMSRIAVDLRDETFGMSSANAFVWRLLLRAALQRTRLDELVVIMPKCSEDYYSSWNVSIPRLVEYRNVALTMIWMLDSRMEQYWAKPTSWLNMTDAMAFTLSKEHGILESPLCNCRRRPANKSFELANATLFGEQLSQYVKSLTKILRASASA